jgi:hypothetical protein
MARYEDKNKENRDEVLEQHYYSRFLGINADFLRLEFARFSTLIFFYKMLFMNIDSSFLVSRVRILKTRGEYGFHPPVEGTVNSMEQKYLGFCQIDVQEFYLRRDAQIVFNELPIQRGAGL